MIQKLSDSFVISTKSVFVSLKKETFSELLCYIFKHLAGNKHPSGKKNTYGINSLLKDLINIR